MARVQDSKYSNFKYYQDPDACDLSDGGRKCRIRS